LSFDPEDYFDANTGISTRAGKDGDRELVLPECPFCGNMSGHFYVNLDKRLFNCYKCDAGGRLVELIAELEGINIIEAKRMMMREAQTVDIKPLAELIIKAFDLKLGRKPEPEAGENVIVELPPQYQPCIVKGTSKVVMPTYLSKRGVTTKMLARFKVGWASSGDYGGRIIWPITTAGSKTFVARLSDDRAYGPKYKNPGDAPMIHFLHNYDRIPKGVLLILVEGVMDVMRLWSYGLHAVALFGKGISGRRIQLIYDLKPSLVISMLDDDALGKAIALGMELKGLAPVKVAQLLAGDPWDSSLAQIKTAIDTSFLPDSLSALKARVSQLKIHPQQ
jgi:DNA primase